MGGGVVALGFGSSQSSVVCFGSGPSLQGSNQKDGGGGGWLVVWLLLVPARARALSFVLVREPFLDKRPPLRNIHSNPLPPSPVRCQRLSIKKQFPHRDQACAMRKRKRMRENVRYGERTRIIHVNRGCRISAESGLQKQSLSRRIRALPNQIRRIRFL